MAKRNQLFNKAIAATIIAFTYFLNGAMAQSQDGSLAPANTKNEGSGKLAETTPLMGHIVVYKVVIDQQPWSLFKQYPPVSQVFLDVVNARSVVIRHSTLTFNAWTKFYKTWEHEVTSSRACAKPILETIPMQDSQCITGRKNIIKLPPGSSPFDFAYFIEWIEGDSLRKGMATLDASLKPVEKKPLQ